MWTKLMVRVWAIAHEPEYRNKAVRNILIFFSAFCLLCELSMIGDWDLIDIGISAGSVTLLIYFGSGAIKELIRGVEKVICALWDIIERLDFVQCDYRYIQLDNGKFLAEYDEKDEFYTDYSNYYIPKEDWEDFVDVKIAIAYAEELPRKEGIERFVFEYLDICYLLERNEGIELPQEYIKARLIDYIRDTDIDDYFDFAQDWKHDYEKKTLSAK